MHDDNMEGTNAENLSSHEVITVELRTPTHADTENSNFTQ